MKILILSFYYEPDLSAGSFRAVALVNALKSFLSDNDIIEVLTTMPNRYISFTVDTCKFEKKKNIIIHRFNTLKHNSSFFDQSVSFFIFFLKVLFHIRNRRYDVVYATSSRLFTAFLGAVISTIKHIPLYLDIRDIFTDTMEDVLRKSRLKLLLPAIELVEKFTLSRADKVNLVSEGFLPYFKKKYVKRQFSLYTNGIDDDFTVFEAATKLIHRNSDKVIFTYAGNIGEGQGLEKIIPHIAKRYANVHFNVVGDGGKRAELIKSVAGLQNVTILKPVGRTEIVALYRQSDVLFMHLNDYDAFKKVLPSKIFEYAATFKPIVAGVSGYAREFINKHLTDCMVFNPCDIDDFCNKYSSYSMLVGMKSRREFIVNFSRKKIMREMALDILNTATIRQ